MNKQKALNSKIYMIICTVTFIAAMYIVRVICSKDISFCIGSFSLQAGEISGVITQLMILLLIWMEMNIRRSYSLCITLILIFTGVMFIPIFTTGSFSSVPGISMNMVGVLILIIIHSYLKKISSNEKKLEYIANTDYLTQLPNRRDLMNTIDDMIFNKINFALVFIDVDNFKKINDAFGHDNGDNVLCEIAIRWNAIKKNTDYIARLGGDEFALITQDYSSEKELIEHVRTFRNAFNQKVVINERNIFISASFGIICSTQCSQTKQMLKYADIAMYDAKFNSPNRICVFKDEMESKIRNVIMVENLIRSALDENNFFLEFQPQFNTINKKLRGFETLIRMRDQDDNIIRPDMFIPISEQSNLIIEVDQWVLINAMSIFKRIIDEYDTDIILSINISAVHIHNNNFISNVKAAIHTTGFPTKNLEIEVTESVLISFMNEAIDKLNELKDMGISIALDDFGTGYASLSYLKTLPIDLLKIDKTFIDNIANSDDERDFVEAMISLGHIMHYSVISEGVENEEQLEILKFFNCDQIQGFLWGKPMSAEDAEELIRCDQRITQL